MKILKEGWSYTKLASHIHKFGSTKVEKLQKTFTSLPPIFFQYHHGNFEGRMRCREVLSSKLFWPKNLHHISSKALLISWMPLDSYSKIDRNILKLSFSEGINNNCSIQAKDMLVYKILENFPFMSWINTCFLSWTMFNQMQDAIYNCTSKREWYQILTAPKLFVSLQQLHAYVKQQAHPHNA